MNLSNQLKRRLRIWLMMVGFSTLVVGPAINLLLFDRTVESLLRGLMDGAIIGALVGGYHQFVRELWMRTYFRRLNFSANVLLSAFAYLLLFQIGRILGTVLRNPDEIGGMGAFLFEGPMLIAIPIFFLVLVFAEFLLQMNRLVGHNVLRYFLLGTYHRPHEEERIFMFLDLQGSTPMAEQMGGKAYYELLELFVDGLTEPVLATHGEIHEYVGDEVVITWRRKAGLQNANCLRCYFLIDDRVTAMAAEYERRFSRVPQFRAGLHAGVVIAGELGDIKRDIVFVGDTINTAARLEEFAKKEDYRFVVSDSIIDTVDIPDAFEATYITDHQPRGKAESVRLYDVSRKQETASPAS